MKGLARRLIPRPMLVRADRHEDRTIDCCLADQILSSITGALVFFYAKSVPPDVIENALRTVLPDFWLLGGRLTKRRSSLYLEARNQGVPFSKQRSERTMDETLISLPQIDVGELVQRVRPGNAFYRGGAIFTVKVTAFAGGGMALGLGWHHSIGDMQTLVLFMHALGAAVSGQDYRTPLVVADREAYFRDNIPPQPDDDSYFRTLGNPELLKYGLYLASDGRKKTTVTFYFTGDELARMRDEISTLAGRSLSMNDVISAHLFSVVEGQDPVDKPRVLSCAVNFRGRLGFPDNAVGNFVVGVDRRLEPGVDVGALAGDIRDSVDHFCERHMKYHGSVAYIHRNGGAKRLWRFIPASFDPIERNLLITNWCRFGVYDLDLAGNRPVFFYPLGGLPFPWMSGLVEGFQNEGVIYNADLPPEVAANLLTRQGLAQMHKYRKDDDLPAGYPGMVPWLH